MRCIRHLLSSAALLAVIATAVAPATAAVAGQDKGAVTNMMVLQIDQEVRNAAAVEGGAIRGSAVTEKGGKKHLAGIVVDPIRATVGVDDFTALISAALADSTALHRLNGSIYGVSFDGKVLNQREFLNGILTEVDFPALDPTSKEPARLGIVIEPESMRQHGAGGAAPPAGGSKSGSGRNKIVAGFTVDIPGVDASRVSKIDAITVKRKVSESPTGEMRDYTKVPAVWEIPNIVLTVPQQYAADLLKWHEDFVIKGICDEAHEKNVTLTAIDQTGAPLLTLNLGNVGILAVAPQPTAAGDQIARVRVELYAERLTLGGGSAGGKSAAGSSATPDAPAPAPAPTPAAGAAPAAPGDKSATATPDAPAPAPAPAGTPVTPVAPRKKRPAPTLTEPAPAEPVQKPARKTPTG